MPTTLVHFAENGEFKAFLCNVLHWSANGKKLIVYISFMLAFVLMAETLKNMRRAFLFNVLYTVSLHSNPTGG